MTTGAFMPTRSAPPNSSGSSASRRRWRLRGAARRLRSWCARETSMDCARRAYRPGRALDGLETHVAGEAVGDHYVDHAVHDVAALDVAVEVDTPVGGDEPDAPRSRRECPWWALRRCESRPTVGLWDAHHLPGKRLSHHGELAQMLGAALGIGAHVEKGDGRWYARHDGADRRTLHARDACARTGGCRRRRRRYCRPRRRRRPSPHA